MPDELATVEPKAEVVDFIPPVDMVVLAKDPHEMELAQAKLIGWARGRTDVLRHELAEAEENLAIAKKGKYRMGPWQRQVRVAKKRLTYYEKVHAALEAGYCIVPDFPISTIAVRTDQKKVSDKVHKGYSVPDIKSKELPTGEGEYTDPQPVVNQWTEKRTRKNTSGEKYEYDQPMIRAWEFDDVDFPFHIVKPRVLEQTTRAMTLKVFDEIGVLPAMTSKRNRDPMVIGRIVRKEGSYQEHSICFLISWWIDTRQL
jgi:hypothetical protein